MTGTVPPYRGQRPPHLETQALRLFYSVPGAGLWTGLQELASSGAEGRNLVQNAACRVHWFPGAALTRCHELGVLKTTGMHSLTALEAGSLTSALLAGPAPETCLPSARLSPFLLRKPAILD